MSDSLQGSVELSVMGQQATGPGCEGCPDHGARHHRRVQHLRPRRGAAQGQGGQPKAHGGLII